MEKQYIKPTMWTYESNEDVLAASGNTDKFDVTDDLLGGNS